MGLAQDLIEQAYHLATRDIAGRPKQASLRRAVSSAYYGLFHFLVDQASRLVVGGQDLSLRAMVARGFDHSAMKRVSVQFANGSLSAKFLAALGSQPIPVELRTIAKTFTTLQEWRHWADYDLRRRFGRDRVRLLIEQTEQGMALWPHVQDAPASRLYLLVLLIGDSVRE